ncbi:MAG: glutamine synthetase [Desulfuromonas sp.]|nr:glutamine synthetase [Desulfuromonas sp.]
MISHLISLNPNKIVQYLKKPADEFTRQDLVKFITENEIKMVNFRYVGGDGRLKKLNFILHSMEHLQNILSFGERVDGSSLFTYIHADNSDLYVVPRFKTAFVNPFSPIPAVDILCSYYTSEGTPLLSSPEQLVHRAHTALKAHSGYTLEAMGELEYYLFSATDTIYPIEEQRGYHESHPFAKWTFIREEAMQIISEIGGRIKYGHAEVGNILHEDEHGQTQQMVQHEIEFLPTPIEDAADQLLLAKWAVREVAYKHNLEVSFAPKIIVGQAGSGLHVHSRLVKNGENLMVGEQGLTDTAKRLIAGYLDLAPALCAFGNTVPTSYLRLVPHQEAPTSICWGERNRSVLVRVPLGWQHDTDMVHRENPLESDDRQPVMSNQTVEIRSPDGSANIHQLFAGLAVAACHGLLMENALQLAEQLHVPEDAAARSDLQQLPASCYEAALALDEKRAIFEQDGIFPASMIDKLIATLQSHQDQNLSEKIFGDTSRLQDLVQQFIYCG